MSIDVKTVIFLIGVLSLFKTLILFYQYRINSDIKATAWWFAWSLTELSGSGLIWLRNKSALLPVSIIFQDILFISGILFLYIGVVLFFRKKVNRKLVSSIFISFAFIHLFFYIIIDNLLMRTVLFDLYVIGIALLTVLTIHKNRTKAVSMTANFNISVLLIHILVFSFRMVLLIIGVPIPDLLSQNYINFIQYFDVLIVGLVLTFGLIIMLNQFLNYEISEVKNHFEKIFEVSPSAIIISRLSDGLFISCNEGFTKIFGFLKEDFSGKTTLGIKLWKNPSDRLGAIKVIEKNGSYENLEFEFQTKNGETIIGQMSAKQIILNDVPHMIGVIRDITQLKQDEMIIRIKNEELMTLMSEKDRIYSIISHDLRSPFHSLLGLSQILYEDMVFMTKSEIKDIVLRLKSTASVLYALLENLLVWSKMQKGSIQINKERLNLLSAVEESIKILDELSRIKDVKLNVFIPNDIYVMFDGLMFQSVIRNLVSNAVKYTPRGGKIDIIATNSDDNNIIVTVKDSGIGMSPLIMEALFSLDNKKLRTGTEGESSSGLGLMICKEFVGKHNGRIWVESEEGKGSVFSFTIPL
jgi:PAS domain S-box-containing protein